MKLRAQANASTRITWRRCNMIMLTRLLLQSARISTITCQSDQLIMAKRHFAQLAHCFVGIVLFRRNSALVLFHFYFNFYFTCKCRLKSQDDHVFYVFVVVHGFLSAAQLRRPTVRPAVRSQLKYVKSYNTLCMLKSSAHIIIAG